MDSSLNTRRVIIFLLFAFGIAWAIGLVIYLNGGLYNSPIIPSLGNEPIAYVLLTFGYMFAPALANLLTRLVTREGWDHLFLRPNLGQGWLYWIIAWVLPAIFTILGMVVYFAVFPHFFDPGLSKVKAAIAASGQTGQIDPQAALLIQAIGAIAVSPLINGIFTFGGEFGWRGYLLPKLLPLGTQRAVLLQGIIWGVWHWAVIAMGYEYGLGYPGFPWVGMLAFLVFTFSVGTFLAWVTLRSGSVWPAVIGFAAINGISSLCLYVVQGQPNLLLGPFPTGLVAGLAWLIFALVLFFIPRLWSVPEEIRPSRLPLSEQAQ